MKLISRIPFLGAAKLMVGLLLFVLGFHVCVALGWVTNSIVWGGRIQTREEFYALESISLLVNALLIWMVVQRAGYVKQVLSEKVLKISLRCMVGLFALNTLGNLMSKSTLEMALFTPLTCVSAMLCARLALGQQDKTKS